MLSDAEIRGKALATFYDRQHNADGWVPISEINFGPASVDRQVIVGVCRQPVSLGLIDWKQQQPGEGFKIGWGRITGKGVAKVEARWCDEIDIQFPLGDGNHSLPEKPRPARTGGDGEPREHAHDAALRSPARRAWMRWSGWRFEGGQ